MNHSVQKELEPSIPVLGIQFKFFYVSEVAAMLRVSSLTIYKLIHEEKLHAIKIGRAWKVPKKAILSYIRSLNDPNHE